MAAELDLSAWQWLHAELWDEIRQRLPAGCSAELHFFGAHATGAAQSLHAPVRNRMNRTPRICRDLCRCHRPRLQQRCAMMTRPDAVRQARGIYYKGFTPSLEIMSSYRVLLAPLRFGAGLKVGRHGTMRVQCAAPRLSSSRVAYARKCLLAGQDCRRVVARPACGYNYYRG